MSRSLRIGFALVLCVKASGPALSQERPLLVVSASPTGEVGQLADAAEIRITFSEPMVEIGGPVLSAPEWLSIAPAVRANYYWSGSRTLIVTADPDAPLPFATRFTVRVDGGAQSTAKRAIASPYAFTFTTPTIRLLGADWYRKTTRADSSAVIALRFNQPVRPADVLAHTTVRYEPHAFTRPTIGGAARERLTRENPGGVEQFDAKVARAAAVAASNAQVPILAATSWDEQRFPPASHVVVVETREAPAPDGWLRIDVDDRMPSPGGPERAPAQSSTIRLEPTFFVQNLPCSSGCAPGYTSLQFRRPVAYESVTSALSVRDVSAGRAETRVSRTPVQSPPYMSRTTGSQYFDFPALGYPSQPPASTWAVRVDASLQAVDGQVLGYPWLAIVENIHATPALAWTGQVWEAANGRAVPFVARNVMEAQVWAAPIRVADVFARLQSWQQQRNAPLTPDGPFDERRLANTADLFEAHGIDLTTILSRGGTGLAWAAVRARAARPNSTVVNNFDRVQPSLVQITNLGLTVKDSPQSTLVFVTRLDNAQPVAGARVAIHTAGGPIWSGTTGADGVAMAPALALRSPRNPWQLAYVASAEKDGDVAWVASDWIGDVHPSSMGMWYGLDEGSAVLRGSIFTDRGVYTKGEEVKLKAVLRSDSATGMRLLPQDAQVVVTLKDARGQEIDRRTFAAGRWSSFDWSLRLPAEASLGYYSVGATLETTVKAQGPNDPPPPLVRGSFLVAAFRRPDFRVETAISTPMPILGSTLAGTVEAKYLFGAPIGRQPVRWFAVKQGIERVPDAIRQKFPERQFAFGYRPEGSPERPLQRQLPEHNESLDAAGRLKVEVPTTAGEDFPSAFGLEGEVSNAAGQRIANRAEVVLHPASFYVGLAKPPFFVDVRKGLSASVVAASLDGVARAGVPVTVSLWREEWTTERRPENPGSASWIRKETASGEWKVTTALQPVPLSIPLGTGGSYILRATATDESGRPTRTDTRFYALGGGASSWRSDGNRITLVPERGRWSPGETARILVQSPWDQATALVTKEREGVLTRSRVAITSMQDAVEVPITEADVPNVYVSVVLVKGRTPDEPRPDNIDPGRPSVRVGYTELVVDDASKRLAVSVRANREEFRPRDRVDVSVSVADAAGRPRAGEVTLWAMDHGLLSLTAYSTPDVARAVYARKQLQVQTQDTRLRLIARQPFVREVAGGVAGGQVSGAGGGGRGGVGLSADRASTVTRSISMTMDTLGEAVYANAAPAPPPAPAQLPPGVELRTDFRPLVFWLGSIATDASGRATTTVSLPDSLTTYRIMAVAGDLESHFGAGDTEIRASKPLTLLPSFPRFLSRGDRASFGAIVTNNTGVAGDATVTIASLDSAVSIGGSATHTTRLAAGESRNVRFDVTAQGLGAARIRMVVTLGSESDAFEMPLAVTAPLTIETVAAYGDTTTSATERIRLPAGIQRDRGGLTVSLASTALVGLGESARYLQEYPYECAEQQASRALALLLSSDLGGAFGAERNKPDELRSMALRLLADLAAYQCPDGGFGSFPGSCFGPSPAYLTAYVAHVLQRSHALGAKTDALALNRALDFLQNQLRQAPPEAQWWPVWAASQAFAMRVLAEGGRKPSTEINRLYSFADRLPIFALSYLADSMAAVGDRGARYQDLVRRINNALRLDADRAHVEEVHDAALLWLWNSNVRATAVVLDGLSRRKDDATFVAPLVRWLLAARRNGRWGTTQENAAALGALVTYYRAFETEVPDFAATVTLGGRPIGTGRFSGRSTTSHQIRLDMPELAKAVAGAASHDLTVSRSGAGRLFYTARLQYASLTPPAPVDRGIRIERRYQRYTPDALGPAATSFADGDLVRVTLTVTLRHEGRFLAFTDPIPAGFEPVDGTLKTTAMDLGVVSTTQPATTERFAWWRRGGFDHVEKHDDKVLAFATRLAAGRHELTYLVRATTAGTFAAAGTFGEAMYAPEIMGRGTAATVTVK